SRFDHESCGVGFVATLRRASNHDILRLALTALARLAHRGAVAADRKSSDGVGILAAVPRSFLVTQTGIALPPERPLAAGMLFLPQDEAAAASDATRFEECIAGQGLQWLAWRDVPRRPEVLGGIALASVPIIRQVLIATCAPSRREPSCTRRCVQEPCSTSSTQTLKAESSLLRSRFSISATRPTCCHRGIARNHCACWRTTARSTPSGAIARIWKPGVPPSRQNA